MPQFSSTHALFDYCKEKGILLFVVRDEEGSYARLEAESGVPGVEQGYVELSTVRATESDTGDEVNDNLGIFGHLFRANVENAIFVAPAVSQEINSELHNENSESRKVSSWPVHRNFLYLDVSGYSRMPTGQQVLTMQRIVAFANDLKFWRSGQVKNMRDNLESEICIGDGYIFVFKDCVPALYFAANLARVIEYECALGRSPIGIHFRMGIHLGEVLQFWDPGRNGWNYCGDAINGGNRVLAAIGSDADDVIFVSDEVKREVLKRKGDEKGAQFLNVFENKGIRIDKHGRRWRVHQLNHHQIDDLYVPGD